MKVRFLDLALRCVGTSDYQVQRHEVIFVGSCEQGLCVHVYAADGGEDKQRQ